MSLRLRAGIAAAGVIGLFGSSAHAQRAVAWGYNGVGQLGNGTVVNSVAPVSITGLVRVSSVGAGHVCSLAVQEGAAWQWGQTSGAGSDIPVIVAGLTSGVTAVDGGVSHCVAVENGGVFAWGGNNFGQLGQGPGLAGSETPLPVVGLSSGVSAVSAGYDYSLAVRNGAAYSWGRNGFGQLGDGTNANRNVPVMVVGLTGGVTGVSAGYSHSLAIQNGAAYAWGQNGHGQLGNGTIANSNAPVAVIGLASGVTAVATGGGHSLAIRDGNVYAWGQNSSGQLGNFSTVDGPAPVLVLDLAVDVVAVAAGSGSSYALGADGSLWVWGSNTDGALGLGEGSIPYYYTAPQKVSPLGGFKFTGIASDAWALHAVAAVEALPPCGSTDFDCDGDAGTSADIEAFFACLAGRCPGPPCVSSADFDGDGDSGTDADIEAFFRALAGAGC